MPGEVKCPQCGFQILSGQKLCRNCGSRSAEKC
ncbi:zinc-ribbon domain-containing protein [bacterium]|nr:zinc-ribbon domain-containing protein [bacterium]